MMNKSSSLINKKILGLIALSGFLTIAQAGGPSYSINKYVISSGGSISSGGDFTVQGSIGQVVVVKMPVISAFLTPMPAVPIAIDASLEIDLLANVYGSDSLLTATLLCNYQYNTSTSSFTWPVQVSGAPGAQVQVVPSLNTEGLLS